MKYKTGDKVRIVKYGHAIWVSKKSFRENYNRDRPDNVFAETLVTQLTYKKFLSDDERALLSALIHAIENDDA